MEKLKKFMEVYPLLVPSKDLKKLFEPGAYCVNRKNDEVVKMIENAEGSFIFVNEVGEKSYFTLQEAVKNLDFIFYCGESSDPNPDVIFKINGEYILASAGDFLGDQIDEVHLVNVYPKNIGWKKSLDSDKLLKMSIGDIENSLTEKKMNVEIEEVEIAGADIYDMIYVIDMPKFLEGKVIFSV
jgi:hypothetical protein